uniref:Uncharacterized protein n=1 Tax=viral metagenome TaxID=1070528 RepID=A0A2V0R9D4_9ZZZZ
MKNIENYVVLFCEKLQTLCLFELLIGVFLNKVSILDVYVYVPAEDSDSPEETAVKADEIKSRLTKKVKTRIKGGSPSKQNSFRGVSELTNLIGVAPRSANMLIVQRPIIPNIGFLWE